ncbi:GntR family transcriptional regulator [Caballeronia hypogeia]|uniref:GntR family transcriptional regulator n=1 Tax=Caballeronia hypogeia TaxID=1777140 RepID=A0A158D6N6_9BURK|nr:FadR/GntR family transcriptional regulator [Caballeronia hypogeia]SAK90133.1 GntR family transcriptional regulator [Caballeronia hypogeia]
MHSLRPSSQIPVHTRDEYAYDQLLALIGSGEFETGERLPGEQTMAERFGVSRPMLRQALARLRSEGKIHSRKGSGHYVSAQEPASKILSYATLGSIPDVRNFLEFRRSLEGESAACAAQLGDRLAISKLKKCHARLAEAFSSGESGIDQDIAFHMAVAQATGNRFFAHTLGALLEQMSFSIRLVRDLSGASPVAPRRQAVIDEHARIVAAIDAGDAGRARDAMRDHIEGGIARLFNK